MSLELGNNGAIMSHASSRSRWGTWGKNFSFTCKVGPAREVVCKVLGGAIMTPCAYNVIEAPTILFQKASPGRLLFASRPMIPGRPHYPWNINTHLDVFPERLHGILGQVRAHGYPDAPLPPHPADLAAFRITTLTDQSGGINTGNGLAHQPGHEQKAVALIFALAERLGCLRNEEKLDVRVIIEHVFQVISTVPLFGKCILV